MHRDFDDFYDMDGDHIRHQHFNDLDHDQYGEDYDPNSESFYDLDTFSLDYAKSLFFGLGNLARYKGFNLVGHKCTLGITEGCSRQEYDYFLELKEQLNKAYENRPFSLLDDEELPPLCEEAAAIEAKLNKLAPRCLNGPCEPCTAAEHAEYLDQFINSGRDDPQDLYHRNNQTILDPSAMPATPVDPSQFVSMAIEKLTTHGAFISDEMPELLEYMCRLFNFSIQPNQDLPRTIKNLVFPAETGTGKSVSVQVYASLLEEHSSIIVVPKVEEAIKYCEEINKLAVDNDYARCYYSVTDKNKDDPLRVEATKLRDYRCIVITHSMFRIINSESLRPSQTTDNQNPTDPAIPYIRKPDIAEYFGTFDTLPRDFVSIDEKLSFYEQFTLDYKELDQLISNIESAVQESKKLGALNTSHNALQALKEFKDFLLFKDDKIVTSDNSLGVKELPKTAEAELIAHGEAITFSDLSSQEQYPKKLIKLKDKEATVEILKSHNVGMQIRKRNVIGISSREVELMGDSIRRDADSFYRERFDPPIGNCLPSLDSAPDQAPSIACTDEDLHSFDDDLDFGEELSEKQLQALINEQESRNDQYGLEFTCSVIKVMLKARVDELFAALEAFGAKKNPTYRQNTLNAIQDKLEDLRYFSRNHFLIYKTNEKKTLLATENLVYQLGLSVVLDATAQINEYYQLANRFLGHVGLVMSPQIRRYKNLTIHKAKGFNQSRSAIYMDKSNQEVEAIARSYASYALNELDADDKMLIICHQKFVNALKKQVNDNRVAYTYWGNHAGSNEWKHCKKVMLIGWNHLPPIAHVSAVNASLDSVLLTSRHLDDEVMKTFAISQLAVDIVQGLMRSKARIIATKESDCKPTSFYLFYKDDDKSRRVLELVESRFPGRTVIDWIPNGEPMPRKKNKRIKNADRVIELLIEKSKDYETYLRSDVEKELNINKSTMTRIAESDYMMSKLAEHGFAYKKKDGKSKHFILS